MIVAIFWLVVLGLLAYFIRRCPIDEPFKTGIIVIICIVAVAIVFNAFFGINVIPGYTPLR